MPTILQLPAANSVGAADEIPISQAGATNAVTVGALLAGTQPAIQAPTGTLLGRNSLGAGGPEPVNVGTGLQLATGTLIATGADHAGFPVDLVPSGSDQVVLSSAGSPKLLSLSALGTYLGGGGAGSINIAALPVVTTIGSSVLVPINQSGTNAAISYGNLLDGETIDEATPAAPASGTDALWVSQGNGTLVRQTFAAIYAWLVTQLPMYRLPVVELTANTTLDGTVHNGRILLCSQPLTLTPAFINMGSGFSCEVLNLSSGPVGFGAGISVLSTSNTLAPNQMALVRAATYSAGNVVIASIITGAASSAPAPSLPGQVQSLAAGAPTATSVALTWAAPSSGGAPSGYTVQYQTADAASWTNFASNVSAISITVTGLTASTSYDFQVVAVNSAGSGTPSSTASASTSATAASVTSIGWNLGPSGSYAHGSGTIALNVHVTPSTSAVQFGTSTSATVPPTTWTAGSFVNTNLWGAYVPIPATAGTYYAWAEGTDGSAPTVYPTAFTVT